MFYLFADDDEDKVGKDKDDDKDKEDDKYEDNEDRDNDKDWNDYTDRDNDEYRDVRNRDDFFKTTLQVGVGAGFEKCFYHPCFIPPSCLGKYCHLINHFHFNWLTFN